MDEWEWKEWKKERYLWVFDNSNSNKYQYKYTTIDIYKNDNYWSDWTVKNMNGTYKWSEFSEEKKWSEQTKGYGSYRC